VRPSVKFRKLAQQYYDKAKSKGVKFRNKDLRRLQSSCGTGNFSGLFDLYYGASAKIDKHGDLILGNPIADIIPNSMGMWKALDLISKPEANIYHQPVIIGLEHGIGYGEDK
jgi:hypothetical protein